MLKVCRWVAQSARINNVYILIGDVGLWERYPLCPVDATDVWLVDRGSLLPADGSSVTKSYGARYLEKSSLLLLTYLPSV